VPACWHENPAISHSSKIRSPPDHQFIKEKTMVDRYAILAVLVAATMLMAPHVTGAQNISRSASRWSSVSAPME
jgi:hypothetical protein